MTSVIKHWLEIEKVFIKLPTVRPLSPRNIVNVPADVVNTVNVLPILSTEAETIKVQLKTSLKLQSKKAKSSQSKWRTAIKTTSRLSHVIRVFSSQGSSSKEYSE